MQRLWIPGILPGLNEAINLRGAGKGFSNPWATSKKKWHSTIGLHARHQGLKPFGPCCWTYLFNCKDKRHDLRNVSSIAAKLLEDGLVENEYIPNDGWDEVLDYRDYFRVTTPVGVHLFLHDRILTLEECLEVLGERKVPTQPSLRLG